MAQQNSFRKVSFFRLRKKAYELRVELIKMLEAAGSGHCGGSLSSAEIMATLYFNILRHEPSNPGWEERDRFILSKGHCAPILYVTMAGCGYIPKEELLTLNKLHSRLQNHPGKLELPILEASTGSLGQGVGIAIGMAIASRLDKKASAVYCLMGDGEHQEGSCWEALMSASHYKLDNLCVIVDVNGLQLSGRTKDIMSLGSLKQKYKSFGWKAVEVNGHSPLQLIMAFHRFKKGIGRRKKPFAILARTVKGKGVSFMEGKAEWHGKAPNSEEAKKALIELERKTR